MVLVGASGSQGSPKQGAAINPMKDGAPNDRLDTGRPGDALGAPRLSEGPERH